MRFDDCLAFVLKAEGGYTDNKADRGGATNRGITQASYDAWRGTQRLSARPVRDITDDEVRAIYLGDYWLKAGCPALPAPVDMAVFDSAVNCGVSRALRWLQQELGVAADGIAGALTTAALLNREPVEVALNILDKREDYCHELVSLKPSQLTFLHGWLNRIDKLKTEVAHGH